MGTRGYWDVYVLNSGGSWVLDSSDELYVPNNTLAIGKTSRVTPVDLADGSIGTMVGSTKYISNALTFTWYYVSSTDAIITLLEGYLEDAEYIKIVDHLSNEYIGTLTGLNKDHLAGEVDYFDLNATLLIH